MLSFNIGVVGPILVLAGFLVFRRAENSQVKNLGRIAIGLGLMLLALHLIIRTMEPVEGAPALRAIMPSLVQQPVLAALAAALLTWLSHSSVAVVLLIVSLVRAGTLTPAAALTLVVGANFGATIPPFLESSTPSGRRLPLGNMLIRSAGCVVVLPLLPQIAAYLSRLEPDPTGIVVNFHTAFNLALALIFIGPVDLMANLLTAILPEPTPTADPGAPRYLDETVLDASTVALVNAAREALRMTDMVETMLKDVMEVFRTGDLRRAREISRMDTVVDRLGFSVRRYLAEISEQELNEEDSLRSQEIFTFTTNLDYLGDVVSNTRAEFAARKIKQGQPFAPGELEAIGDTQAEVVASLELALAVFMSGDQKTAGQLLERKKLIWRLESQATERYFRRLRETQAQSAETDDFYLRVLRDLRRIHSFIAALAYPPLDRAGRMQQRLVEMPTEPQEVEGPPASGARVKLLRPCRRVAGRTALG
ncbi:MAG: Na/Pi cotransporter family protein [Deltaproteobacteria bacterium]|nr:Na/Pi cotransporter family protein [Deltaproteobacteria bacterium]